MEEKYGWKWIKNMIGKTSDFHKAKVAQRKSCEIGQNKNIKYSISLSFQIYAHFLLLELFHFITWTNVKSQLLELKGVWAALFFVCSAFISAFNKSWVDF